MLVFFPVILWLVVLVGAFVGWCFNIIDVFSHTGPIGVEALLHIAGVFLVPLGVLMGYAY